MLELATKQLLQYKKRKEKNPHTQSTIYYKKDLIIKIKQKYEERTLA